MPKTKHLADADTDTYTDRATDRATEIQILRTNLCNGNLQFFNWEHKLLFVTRETWIWHQSEAVRAYDKFIASTDRDTDTDTDGDTDTSGGTQWSLEQLLICADLIRLTYVTWTMWSIDRIDGATACGCHSTNKRLTQTRTRTQTRARARQGDQASCQLGNCQSARLISKFEFEAKCLRTEPNLLNKKPPNKFSVSVIDF